MFTINTYCLNACELQHLFQVTKLYNNNNNKKFLFTRTCTHFSEDILRGLYTFLNSVSDIFILTYLCSTVVTHCLSYIPPYIITHHSQNFINVTLHLKGGVV